jgi:hypothetical protein
MRKEKFIEVQGKTYTLLGMHGGIASLGLPLDLNNDVVWRGIIWEAQPFLDKSSKVNWLYNSMRWVMGKVLTKKDWSQEVQLRQRVASKIYSDKLKNTLHFQR